jgi:protein-tyrosine phosphatase
VLQFVEQCRANGGVCFVHCAQGVSRSGAVVVYSLMRMHNLSYDAALALARKGRSVAEPNDSFAAQLRKLERK